jgi:hypothetical protein
VKHLMMRTLAVVATGLAVECLAQTLVSCPFRGFGGDSSGQGFYVKNYPGSTLNQVTLHYIPSARGIVTETLTAHVGAFDGPVIGAETLSASPAILTSLPMPFDFPALAVVPGSTIAFTHQSSGVPVIWDTGAGPCANVTETNGTTPPLDSIRGNSYGVQIIGNLPAPEPSPTPTLSTASTILLSLVLGTITFVLIRRRTTDL